MASFLCFALASNWDAELVRFELLHREDIPPVVIDEKMVRKFLGVRRYDFGVAEKTNQIGQVVGLVMGKGVQAAADELASYGVAVRLADAPVLEHYLAESHAPVVAEAPRRCRLRPWPAAASSGPASAGTSPTPSRSRSCRCSSSAASWW